MHIRRQQPRCTTRFWPLSKFQLTHWHVGRINEVTLRRRARLVLGWVTMSGFDSRRRHFISVCNQPPRL